MRSLITFIFITLTCIIWGAPVRGQQQYDPSLYSGMQWRLVGPHRAGRITAVAGVPGRPATYYFGTPGGGLWKTTSGGRVWRPIFDAARVPSIGALALAQSDPEVIYVGTGEQLKGDGVYKSNDGGSTWVNVGLRDAYAISSLVVDPRDPNTVLAAAVGGPIPGQARGVFKSTDGGKTWNRTLFKDDQTNVMDMCATPEDSRVIYASTITRQPATNNARPLTLLSEIFKSTDGGSTWQLLAGPGLPGQPRGRIGVAAAAGGGGGRVYAIMNQGFFRSDDGGDNWRQITADPRVVGSGYFSRTFVDPKNADTVYVMQTTMYRSTDGGKTFDAYKGAPSGEDQHVLWIAPDDPQRMILGSDQGAIVSVDGGRTWTSWFNQPTGEMYHVKTDNNFPYRLYASQQDSGSVVVNSRSDYGQITYRDWFSSGSFESGNIAPDPANPNLIYSIGWFGSVLRLDHSTGQISTVFVPGAEYRYTWETPLVYSPADPKMLYVGMQKVLKTSDGASTWQEISPDLTERANPAADKDGKPRVRGVIQVIAPSAVQASEIWVGTSTGLVQLTLDGGSTWQNVTPTAVPPNSAIISIEASPSEAETAYAVASVRNESRPYIYRTRDAGKTWQKIVAGLPEAGAARVVREDPARKGLMYAGTEKGVHVSFDGGNHWQSLQLNLPTTSVRDLAVHGSDLVAATYGRGLWIVDDLSPLREIDEKTTGAQVYLFRPETALRVRWDNHPDTPLPADTPAGQNPPEGAIIDYYLKSNVPDEITLEIRDERGNTVRRFSSAQLSSAPELPGNAPDYWFAPPDVLSTKAGAHRFVWNLRWPDPAVLPYSFYGTPLNYIEYTLPDHAVPGQTPRHQPPGPLAVPGTYEVVLTVGRQTYHHPLHVVLDPRVKAPRADLEAQLGLAIRISNWMATSYNAYNAVTSLRSGLAQSLRSLAGESEAKDVHDTMTALDKELGLLQNGTGDAPSFGTVNRDLSRFMTMIEGGDMRPARSALDNSTASCEWLGKSLERWRKINAESLPALNGLLAKYKLRPLGIVAVDPPPVCGN